LDAVFKLAAELYLIIGVKIYLINLVLAMMTKMLFKQILHILFVLRKIKRLIKTSTR
jgi:hypothetical protein